MPREERVLVVLVASPSDLEPERNRLEDVIRELNLTWSRTLGVRLELVRWETHGYPGIGSDAQDVLNQELPNDYDIFVGLMWGRYGTQTERAGSGTEEEFLRALSRFRADPSAVRIMFYFKDAPLPPSSLDPEQLSKVKRFRASLGEEGGLHFTFVSIDEFEKLIRLHLARQIQDFQREFEARKAIGPAAGTSVVISSPVAVAPLEGTLPEEEVGILDLLDLLEERSATLAEITQRIVSETDGLTQRTHQRTEELNAATARAHALTRREARTLLDKSAVDLHQFAARVQAELPLFSQAVNSTAEAAAQAALLTADMYQENEKELEDARRALSQIHGGLDRAFEATAGFQATIKRLPRMTSALNRSKREVVELLGELLEAYASGRRIVSEASKALAPPEPGLI